MGMDKIRLVDEAQLKKDIPKFNIGDTVRVFVKIKEEDKTRLQAFEGTIIRKHGSSVSKTFTVRRISYGEGIERIFPLSSPNIDHIEIIKGGKVRRAKLYYLRKLVSKKKSKIEKKIYEGDISGESGSLPEGESKISEASPDVKV